MPISTVKFNDWQAVPPENISRHNFIPDHTTEHMWRILFIIQILVAIVDDSSVKLPQYRIMRY